MRAVLVPLLQRVRVSIPAGARIDPSVHGIIMGPKRAMTLELRPVDARAPAPEPLGGKVRALVDLA